ncbi:hypothetical protein [Henriciella marina]|uniref:hypothetical protein n=1 Tax=Henriciella marina TaxID=453851 RepID=UPI00058FCEEC|nr:hypothetical protein [Henriciella marina]
MHEQARYSSGVGWIWPLLGLIVIILLLFGAWWIAMFSVKQSNDPIYQACTDTYGGYNCQCFAGILRVQLSQRAYDAYVDDLERDEYRHRYFDGRLAENSFIGRDADVCVEASDICKVPVCEPRYHYPQDDLGIGGALPPQIQDRPYVGAPGTLDQGS